MAVDAYMVFQTYDGKFLGSESQVTWNDTSPLAKDSSNGIDMAAAAKATPAGIFEIEDYSFDIEQTLNIGSQSSGAGAGKVTFNPFSITRKIDVSSPIFFQMACAGQPFKNVSLLLRKSSGGPSGTPMTSGSTFVRFDFKLVAVKTVAWSHDDESPKETITFEYGQLQVRYTAQKPDGSMDKINQGSWNRVNNVSTFKDLS